MIGRFDIGLFFRGFQKYVAICVVVALVRGYWEQSLTEYGFMLFKLWLTLCALVSGAGYVYFFSKKIKVRSIGLIQYLLIGLFVILTVMIFEYSKK
jgi:hypothetical protein